MKYWLIEYNEDNNGWVPSFDTVANTKEEMEKDLENLEEIPDNVQARIVEYEITPVMTRA